MNMIITESDKRLLSYLAAFLVLVLFVFGVFKPLSQKNAQLEREILTTKDQELAMDMAASLADDMVKKEENTKSKMTLVLQRFYPVLQSQEAENMMTVLMLNHNLKIQNMSVSMPDAKSDLKWYQYKEGYACCMMEDATYSHIYESNSLVLLLKQTYYLYY